MDRPTGGHPTAALLRGGCRGSCRTSNTVRVADALAVYRDADGAIGLEHLSNLTKDESIEARAAGISGGSVRA